MASSARAPLHNVVLDANVLLQAPIRDTLLRLAEHKLLAVFWSSEILAEVERNFAVVTGPLAAATRCQRLLLALARSFPGAIRDDYQEVLPTVPIPQHDRHVLACAIISRASTIVTYNTRHFSDQALASYRIQALHPDMFLSLLLRQIPGELLLTLNAQGAALHPPLALPQLLDRLARDVPQFVAQARHHFIH